MTRDEKRWPGYPPGVSGTECQGLTNSGEIAEIHSLDGGFQANSETPAARAYSVTPSDHGSAVSDSARAGNGRPNRGKTPNELTRPCRIVPTTARKISGRLGTLPSRMRVPWTLPIARKIGGGIPVSRDPKHPKPLRLATPVTHKVLGEVDCWRRRAPHRAGLTAQRKYQAEGCGATTGSYRRDREIRRGRGAKIGTAGDPWITVDPNRLQSKSPRREGDQVRLARTGCEVGIGARIGRHAAESREPARPPGRMRTDPGRDQPASCEQQQEGDSVPGHLAGPWRSSEGNIQADPEPGRLINITDFFLVVKSSCIHPNVSGDFFGERGAIQIGELRANGRPNRKEGVTSAGPLDRSERLDASGQVAIRFDFSKT